MNRSEFLKLVGAAAGATILPASIFINTSETQSDEEFQYGLYTGTYIQVLETEEVFEITLGKEFRPGDVVRWKSNEPHQRLFSCKPTDEL